VPDAQRSPEATAIPTIIRSERFRMRALASFLKQPGQLRGDCCESLTDGAHIARNVGKRSRFCVTSTFGIGADQALFARL